MARPVDRRTTGAADGTETAPPRRADLATRDALLARLAAPPGTVVVARRPGPSGDVLVVRATAPDAVPPDRRPTRFRGFAVVWVVIAAPRAGRW